MQTAPDFPFLVAFDCETWLVLDGAGAPPCVCFGWSIREAGKPARVGMITRLGEQDTTRDVLPVQTMSDALRHLLGLVMARPASESRFINQTPDFDLAVMAQHDPDLLPLIFEAYAGGWIEDIMLREQLIDLALGHMGYTVQGDPDDPQAKRSRKSYSLAAMAKARLDVDLDKKTWRLGYRDLHDTPLVEWPAGARQYVCDDVIQAMNVWEAQRRDVDDAEPVPYEVTDSVAQARASFGLRLISWWGIRTDRREVQLYKGRLQEAQKVFTDALLHTGMARVLGRKDPSKFNEGIRDGMTRLAAMLPDSVLAQTPKGAIATTDEAVGDLAGEVISMPQDLPAAIELAGRVLSRSKGPPATRQEIAEALAVVPWHTHVQKMLSTYVTVLEDGQVNPIMPRYETLKENGRTSATHNIQTLPKEYGPRNCHVARPGTVFSSVDYEALELHTLASVVITKVGWSKLAEALNRGQDVHTMVMVPFMGMTYDQAVQVRAYRGDDPELLAKKKKVSTLRNYGKVLNFGLGAAMSAERLKAHFKKQGVMVTLDEADGYRKAWFKSWPEMREYHRMVSNETVRAPNGDEKGTIIQHVSRRVRADISFTEIANGYFSGLANDGAKAAMFELQRACYVPGGTLYGSRIVAWLHDESLMEHPVEDAHERAFEQARIMCEVMQRYTPQVRIKAKPALMTHWHKDAEDVYDPVTKRLVPWQPAKKK